MCDVKFMQDGPPRHYDLTKAAEFSRSMTQPMLALALVAVFACCGTTAWLTMRSLSQSTELSRLAASTASMQASMTEQFTLAAAARKSLEEQLRDATDANKSLRKQLKELKDGAATADALQALASKVSPLETSVTVLTGKVEAMATDANAAKQSLDEKLAELDERLSEELAAHASTVADLHTGHNDTTAVLQALVEQVVTFKKDKEVTKPQTTKVARAAQDEASDAATIASPTKTAGLNASPPPPAPALSPPVAEHANGMAAKEAETTKMEEAMAKAKVDSTGVQSAAAMAAMAAAEVAPEGMATAETETSQAAAESTAATGVKKVEATSSKDAGNATSEAAVAAAGDAKDEEADEEELEADEDAATEKAVDDDAADEEAQPADDNATAEREQAAKQLEG